MLYNRCTGIYKFGNNTYPQRIRRGSNLGHIFRGGGARLMDRDIRYLRSRRLWLTPNNLNRFGLKFCGLQRKYEISSLAVESNLEAEHITKI